MSRTLAEISCALVTPIGWGWRGFRQIVRLSRATRLGSCGHHARFDPFGSYWPISKMHFGANTFVGPGARIAASEGFYLGDGSFTGPELLVIGGDHNIRTVGAEMHAVRTGGVNLPVVVNRDVFIGARVTILKGVTIGEGSVIGASSVVDKSIPPYTVALGAPCRPARPRFTIAELDQHLASVGSTLTSEAVLSCWREAGLKTLRTPFQGVAAASHRVASPEKGAQLDNGT